MKTKNDLAQLSDKQLQTILAELQGWLPVNDATVPDRIWPCLGTITGENNNWMMFPPSGYMMANGMLSTGRVACSPPSYTTDLNATASVKKTLTKRQKEVFIDILDGSIKAETDPKAYIGYIELPPEDIFDNFNNVTARDECIALILTLQP